MKKRRTISATRYDTSVIPGEVVTDEDGQVLRQVDSETALFGQKFTYVSKMNMLYACAELTHREMRLFMFMHCTANKSRLIIWSPMHYRPFTMIDKSCLSAVKNSLVRKGFISKKAKQLYQVADMRELMPGAKAMAASMRERWWTG